MAIHSFSGDEYKDEINPREWLRMMKENNLRHFKEIFYLIGEYFKWWDSLEEGTKLSHRWELLSPNIGSLPLNWGILY
jgi:hypothetical protein